MNFGINTFLFTSPFTNESVSWFPQFREWGFDSVEIALEDPANIDPQLIRKELDKNNLSCTTICAAMGPGRDLRGSQEDQDGAFSYITNLLEVMPILGATMLVGPLYSSVGRAEQVTPEDYKKQWLLASTHLRALAEKAETAGLKLAVEPLNRFETDFINTTKQAIDLVQAINSPAVGIHLDTFHMNIEEKSLPDAIRLCGSLLWHFHACGSDRGTPGNDHTDWKGIVEALKSVQYEKSIVIESFTTDVKAIAKAAAIWREIEKSREEIASAGVTFLKGIFK
ncbi:MAG TPA: sugar phosphate isomerase/epimerase family protein [Pedobacter sp.]|jgi:D-psicose/D-tagatose/L-ribulose 3-epimerase